MTGTAASAPDASERVLPLLRGDPPRLGDIALSGRLEVTDAGIVYAGVLADEPVAVALLTAGAEPDGYARARFHDAVRDARLAGTRHHGGRGRGRAGDRTLGGGARRLPGPTVRSWPGRCWPR